MEPMTTEPVDANQQRGLVIISALLNFIDWLEAQDMLTVSPLAGQERAELVKLFLHLHSDKMGYFKQADEIAGRLGAPFEREWQ